MGVPDAHPAAGKTGTGPPVAPANWGWRCGNRIKDMYFYSPDGKKIRSRPELASYLGKHTNGPSPDEFCWRVTEEILKTGKWTKEESSSPAKASTPRSARKKVSVEHPSKKPRQARQNGVGATESTKVPPVSVPIGELPFSAAEPLAVRAPDSIVSKKETTFTSRAKVKARKDKTETVYTFKEILAENSSFKWLHNSGTLERFLEEASKLNESSAEEIKEWRNLLVARNLQVGNITKYPNPILRVFVRLLGTDGLGEEPSDSLGKVELADLCVRLAKT